MRFGCCSVLGQEALGGLGLQDTLLCVLKGRVAPGVSDLGPVILRHFHTWPVGGDWAGASGMITSDNASRFSDLLCARHCPVVCSLTGRHNQP